jgi:hypothetical protein
MGQNYYFTKLIRLSKQSRGQNKHGRRNHNTITFFSLGSYAETAGKKANTEFKSAQTLLIQRHQHSYKRRKTSATTKTAAGTTTSPLSTRKCNVAHEDTTPG